MLLDADVLIDLLRNHPPATAWFDSLPEMPPASGFALIELEAGCRNAADLRELRLFADTFDPHWPTPSDMDLALSLFGTLRLRDGIGALDMFTAVTAVGEGRPLATFNTKHYRNVPGLETVQPYER